MDIERKHSTDGYPQSASSFWLELLMHARNKSVEDLVVFSNSRAELLLTLQGQRPHCTEVLLYGWYNVFSRIACDLLCQGRLSTQTPSQSHSTGHFDTTNPVQVVRFLPNICLHHNLT